MPLRAAISVSAFILFAVFALPVLAAKNIPWVDQTFERTSFDEEVSNVLRAILRQNGLQVIFREGVTGSVTAEFRNMPLQGAFEKVIIENGLDYDYDAASRVVTIFASQGGGDQVSELVPLAFISANNAVSAVRRFGLPGEVTADEGSGTVYVEGTREQVAAIVNLIGQVDRQQATSRSNAVSAAELSSRRKKSELRQKLLDKLVNRRVEVFPLRYTNVGSTTSTFHGEAVTLPGIEDSLKRLMGDVSTVDAQLTEDQRTEIQQKAPLSQISAFITSDPRSNSIIVRGTQQEIDQVGRILNQLDRPVPMIELDVLIVNATKVATDELAVNWAYERNFIDTANLSGKQVGGFNTGIASADPTAVTSGLAASGTNAAAPTVSGSSFVFGAVISQNRNALQVQLAALESETETQTIANPRLVTLNNVPAKIESVASQFVTTNTNDTLTVEEINAGTNISITPAVILAEDASQRDLVRLTISIDNSSLAAAANNGTNGGSFTESGRAIETEVILPVGGTFMMGGLSDDTLDHDEQGIPFLRRLPLVGFLFNEVRLDDNFEETIFFISPRIVYPEDIQARDIAERNYLKGRRAQLDRIQEALIAGSDVADGRASFRQEEE
ncbi:MAG: secretin N-terminal domain-containing protein [Magnetovibrionaceae bacterium]